MDSTVQNLPSKGALAPEDIIYVVTPNGEDRKARADAITPALPLATGSAKGLFSSAEKTQLAAAVAAIAVLQQFTTNIIAAQTTIALSAGVYSYVLTGTTTVEGVTGNEDYRHYTFYYPEGAGVLFLGELMEAGDVLEFYSNPD